MCGIAGLIHRGKTSNVGGEMTSMLQALKHRGPDSTGFAVYGPPLDDKPLDDKPADGQPADDKSSDAKPRGNEYIMRFKVAEQEDLATGFKILDQIKERRRLVDERMESMGATVIDTREATEYAFRYRFTFDGDLRKLADFIEDVEGAEILSIGHTLELIKDLGDAGLVSEQYSLGDFKGTHGIGHTRMATESDVDIRSAHPYWAYPFNDIAIVHNGQITNYWLMRRQLERQGQRFMSDCDSELLAVYTADNLNHGATLEESLRQSIGEIDGVFTYVVATADSLGMAKDTMAAKPMVIYESDDLVVLASEEVAIRSIMPREIDTYDPYDEEVRVWRV